MGGARVRGVAVAAAVVVLAAAAAARADEPVAKLALEAGTELDTNPQREGSQYEPVPAAVGRGGIRVSVGWRPAPRRALQVSAVAAAKKFVGGDHADAEDVAVVTGDVRYEARAASAPLALAGRLSYYDAIERGNPVDEGPDHDFRTGDASLALALLGEDHEHATLTAGVRAFQYKPAAAYDFVGEHAQLEWRKSFGADDADGDDSPTWDVGAWYGIARRAYEGGARIDQCPPSDDPPGDNCLVVRSDLGRADLVHTVGAELGYSGERLYGARYEATISRSNSFGESLQRHRLELSATSETVASIFVTVRAVVQVNRFADPVLLSLGIDKLTIEDENRNSLTLHATRDLGEHWSVEARYAFYSNEFATQSYAFRRQTAYLGLVWRL